MLPPPHAVAVPSIMPPLITHIIYRLGVGGMENGLVNLINQMPAERYRHAIICLTDFTEFSRRIARPDVELVCLHKRAGKDIGLYARLYRALRALDPDIVHTRNMAAIEGQLVAACSGVSARVHSEHGREGADLHGAYRRYNLLRKAIQPLVGHYIAVSRDLAGWLQGTIGVPGRKLTQIYNGVDSVKFRPRGGVRGPMGPVGFATDDAILIGSVGRLAQVKDFPTLIRAFGRLRELWAEGGRLRLVIVGEGPMRAECERLIAEQGLGAQVWLAGDRDDVPELMRAMDLFVLPSLGEGISNTILEAMASGLPVLATAVGGNPELVSPGKTGMLIPPADHEKMAQALLAYVGDPARMAREGQAARAEVEARFSLEAMVAGYLRVYDGLLGGSGMDTPSLQRK